MRTTIRSLVLAACILLPSSWSTAQEAAAAKDVTVQLLEAGKEPRRALRLAPVKGAQRQATFVMKMDMTTMLGGQELPSTKLPAQKFTIETTVRDIAENGDATIDFKYVDAGLVDDPNNPSPVAAMMLKSLKPLIGTTGTIVVTNRGFTKSNEVSVPEKADPSVKATLESMKDSLNRISSPYPEEAIGIGGKWKVSQEMTVSGMTLVQESTHEVEQMDDDGFTMKVDLTQTAAAQEIKAPNLPAGAKLSLESLATNGGGHSTVDLSSILPKKVDMKIESNSKMKMDLGGLDQKLDVKTDIEMTIE